MTIHQVRGQSQNSNLRNFKNNKGKKVAVPFNTGKILHPKLLKSNKVNQTRRTVIVVPLSTAGKARPPIAVPTFCLGKQVLAVCDQIRAVDKDRLIKEAGSLPKKDMADIDASLRQVLPYKSMVLSSLLLIELKGLRLCTIVLIIKERIFLPRHNGPDRYDMRSFNHKP
jgi:mRNA interferase MazF